MNIDQLYTVEDHEEGAEMQVKGPDGKYLDMYITLVGMDSKTWRKAWARHKKKLVMTMAEDQDSEEAESQMMAEVTKGWRGFLSDGKEFEFSKERAKKLYLNAPYVKIGRAHV